MLSEAIIASDTSYILVREEKPVVWMIEAPPVAARVRILKALFPQERRYD